MLVGDDRVHLEAQSTGDCWCARRRQLAGLIEIRGLGIRRCDFAAEAVVGLVVDLAAADAERLPPPEALRRDDLRYRAAANSRRSRAMRRFHWLLAALTMTASSSSARPSADCRKGIGNHIQPHDRDRIDRRRPPLPAIKFRENCRRSPLARGLWMVKVAPFVRCNQEAPARSFR